MERCFSNCDNVYSPEKAAVASVTTGMIFRLNLRSLLRTLFIFLCSMYFALKSLSTSALEIPAWVAEPAQDSQEYIYGIGQGHDLASAKQSALEAIAGKIVTQIASSLSIDTHSVDHQVKERVSSNVRSQISNTHISGYHLGKVEEVKGTFWVQVQIGRAALLSANLAQANDLIAKIDAKFAGNKNQNIISLRNESDVLQESINEAISKLAIVKALDPNFAYEPIYNRMLGYDESIRKSKNNFLIHITSDSDLRVLASRVADLLSREGYPATVSSPPGNAPTINIQGAFTESKRFDSIFAFARVIVEIRDENAKPLKSRELTLNGSSMTSYENAKVAAVNKLARELESDGVAEMLGLTK